MNIQHLNELIRVLENVNPIDFNLSEWIVTQADLEEVKEFNNDPLEHKYQQLQDPNNCGTVCCAIGWACQDQYFIENGLTLDTAQIPTHLSTLYNEQTGKSEKQTTHGFRAIKDFFDFENIQTGENLFLDNSYEAQDKTTPEQVIARVRDLIESMLVMTTRKIRLLIKFGTSTSSHIVTSTNFNSVQEWEAGCSSNTEQIIFTNQVSELKNYSTWNCIQIEPNAWLV